MRTTSPATRCPATSCSSTSSRARRAARSSSARSSKRSKPGLQDLPRGQEAQRPWPCRASSRRAMTPRWTSSGPSARRSGPGRRPRGGERDVVAQAGAAVQLHGHVHDALGHVGHGDLDLGARAERLGAPLVEHPRGVPDEQAGLLDGDPRVGDALAVAAQVGERLAEGDALTARSQASSSASSARPTRRMQWCTRPGPRRAWAISKPMPGPPMIELAGRRTSLKGTSPWPPGASRKPMDGEHPLTVTPGASSGTSTIECRWWRSACASLTPMKMAPGSSDARRRCSTTSPVAGRPRRRRGSRSPPCSSRRRRPRRARSCRRRSGSPGEQGPS